MRISDRWLTPGVIVALILGAVVVVLGALAAVTYLAARGVDPSPTLKLAGMTGTGVASLMSLLLTLATRSTVAKTERNTGRLPAIEAAVYDVADALPQPVTVPRHLYPDTEAMPPVNGATPAARGS